MKRGQSPVVPFFRGGEGDGTFNGFVLSKSNLFQPVLLSRVDSKLKLLEDQLIVQEKYKLAIVSRSIIMEL